MQVYHLFVPARSPEPAQAELNQLLAGVRLLAVRREWLVDGPQSGWAYCIEVLPGPGPLPDAVKLGASPDRRRGPDVDYRQVLSESHFATYARLRQARKLMAQRDGVPVYAVASNEQLAAMVTQAVTNLAGLGAIDGMGAARVARYGAELLAVLSSNEGAGSAGTVAPSGPSNPLGAGA